MSAAKVPAAGGNYTTMTRWIIFGLSLAGVGAAFAQPADSCRVRIAQAPPEVRAEIEAWVKAEPRCERELEVRVVPTQGGELQLSATDDAGRVRERVVPDAQSAAVLVVSWMADDGLSPRIEPAPVVLPVVPVAPVGVEREAPAANVRGHAGDRGALIIGALGGRDGGGLRAQLDLVSGRRWSLGLAGGRVERRRDAETSFARIVVGARGAITQRVSLRAQLGLGVEADLMDRMRGEVRPSLELAAFAGVRLLDRWGLSAGPVITASPERPSVGGFLGVQRGL